MAGRRRLVTLPRPPAPRRDDVEPAPPRHLRLVPRRPDDPSPYITNSLTALAGIPFEFVKIRNDIMETIESEHDIDTLKHHMDGRCARCHKSTRINFRHLLKAISKEGTPEHDIYTKVTSENDDIVKLFDNEYYKRAFTLAFASALLELLKPKPAKDEEEN